MSNTFGPWLPITSPQTLDACKHMKTFSSDVFICSYPKSGTTWMQNIVAQIITKGETLQSFAHISHVAPFFEIDPHWDHHSSELSGSKLIASIQAHHTSLGRRCFNTHLPWELMPKPKLPPKQFGSQDTDTPSTSTTDQHGSTRTTERMEWPKYIYVVRDGRDVACSFFHHLSSQSVSDGGYSGTWDEFFTEWVAGKIAFGSWPHHLQSWYQAFQAGIKNHHNSILIIHYSDMLSNLKDSIDKVARHINVHLTSSELDRIATKCDFATMRQDLDRFQPKSVQWSNPTFRFLRKGTTGDYKSLFSEQQLKQFDESVSNAWVGQEGLAANASLLFHSSFMHRTDW